MCLSCSSKPPLFFESNKVEGWWPWNSLMGGYFRTYKDPKSAKNQIFQWAIFFYYSLVGIRTWDPCKSIAFCFFNIGFSISFWCCLDKINNDPIFLCVHFHLFSHKNFHCTQYLKIYLLLRICSWETRTSYL